MARRFDPSDDVLFVIDIQDPFIDSIENGQNVLKRAEFLVNVASLLPVPMVCTQQVPSKLGPLCGTLVEAINQTPIFSKSTFSSLADPAVAAYFSSLEKKNVILIGVETHICVTGTALDLIEAGYQVAICPDAVGASSLERHKLGMEQLRDSGVVPAHTESVVYDWLRSSEHPMFRDVLRIVKSNGQMDKESGNIKP